VGWIRGLWDLNRAVARAGSRAGASFDQAIASRNMNRGVRLGVLAPGDPPPGGSAGGSYYDYRGTADIARLPAEYRSAPFPLGSLLHPRRGIGDSIGLFPQIVDHHVVVVGPSGAGKTTSVIVPWLLGGLGCGYTVVTIDVKGDLLDKVRDEVGSAFPQRDALVSIDYRSPNESLKWNWIDEMDSPEAIDGVVQAINGKDPPPNTDPYHYYSDAEILRALLEVASTHPDRRYLTTKNLVILLRNQANFTKLAARHPDACHRVTDLVNLYPDEYAKKISGVAARLGVMTNSKLEAITNNSEIKSAEILQEQRLLSVVAPMQDGLMARSLSALFINQLLHHAFGRFGNRSGYPLLLVIDEAAQLADRIDLPNVLSVARSSGVAIVIALQDVAHIKDKDERSVILANCGTMICFGGVSNITAETMSNRLGQHPVQTASLSTGLSGDRTRNVRTTSVTTTMAPILGTREIMSPPFGDRIATVHCRDLNSLPFLVDLTRRPPP